MAVGWDHAPAAAKPDTPMSGEQHFATVLRGYDRTEVDAFLADNAARLAGLETEVSDAQRLRLRAVRRAEELEGELRRAGRATAAPDAGSGFGARAEKLIRLAEQEAAEVRAEAHRDAAANLEKTRTEAEAHRHDVEQALIAREARLEEDVAQRSASLAEQEQRAADQVIAAREHAERVRAEASRAADGIRAAAEAGAAELVQKAEALLRRRQEDAGKEVDRMSGLLADVRADVARLAGVLTAELSPSPGPRGDAGA